MSSSIQFRPAREADLESAYDVFYQNEIRGEENPPTVEAVPPYLPHVLRSGKLLVAEQDGKILGYAGAITRDRITYLTDLFVRPDVQSGQIGQRLLELATPQDDGLIHCTASSTDMRALSLYVRAGMQPQWPFFTLRLEKPPRGSLDVNAEIEVSEADPADP
ncbi:MAG: GNAT family N-acetyltransferase [Ktedonobacteraceae bacterium]|nr:GNAT family N-acetyltransferase [Ktedonobacteraceae bacterium]